MGEDSPIGNQDIRDEVSLEQVDVSFKQDEEEDLLLNLRSNRLRNSKTVIV